MWGIPYVQQGSPWHRDYEGFLLHTSEGCNRITTALRKNSAGEDSAIYSARGYHSGCLQAERDPRVILAQSWTMVACRVSSKQGQRNIGLEILRSWRSTSSRVATFSCCYEVPFPSYIQIHLR